MNRIVLLLLLNVPAQAPATPINRGASAVQQTVIPAPQSARHSDSLYVALLEKVNQQVSLSSNPLAIMVSALGVLFAALAIIAGVLVFRQSSDYRKILQTQFDEYRKTHEEQLEKYGALVAQLIEETTKKTNDAITDAQAQLDEAKANLNQASGTEREKLATKVEALEKKVKSLTSEPKVTIGGASIFTIGPKPTADSNTLFAIGPKASLIGPATMGIKMEDKVGRVTFIVSTQTCASCGKTYDLPTSYYAMVRTPTICPYCSHINPA